MEDPIPSEKVHQRRLPWPLPLPAPAAVCEESAPLRHLYAWRGGGLMDGAAAARRAIPGSWRNGRPAGAAKLARQRELVGRRSARG
jgi:hypothetical protein